MLKDLSIPAEEKKNSSVFSVLDKPSYPMGLRLMIDPETFKRLGIEVPDVGSIIKLLASAEVVGVNKENSQDDTESYSVSIQIQQMDVKYEDDEEEEEKTTSSMLYGS